MKEGVQCVDSFLLRLDVSQQVMDQVMAQLKQEGYDCYQTSVGGTGTHAIKLTSDESSSWLLTTDRDTLEQYF